MHPSPPTIPPYLRRVLKEPVWLQWRTSRFNSRDRSPADDIELGISASARAVQVHAILSRIGGSVELRWFAFAMRSDVLGTPIMPLRTAYREASKPPPDDADTTPS
jgi:hypothetical protein